MQIRHTMTRPKKSQKTILTSLLCLCSPLSSAPPKSSINSTTLSPIACARTGFKQLHAHSSTVLHGEDLRGLESPVACPSGSAAVTASYRCARACAFTHAHKKGGGDLWAWARPRLGSGGAVVTCRVPGRMRSGVSCCMW